MKYLIVGDAGSIYIKEYIEYVLLDPANQVVLVQEGSVNDNYRSFYADNNVAVEPLYREKAKFIAKIPRVRAYVGAWFFVRDMVRKYGQFDLVHVHGLNIIRGNIGKYIRKYAKRIVITVWGDELLRKNDRTLQQYGKYYSAADWVTTETEYMKTRFLDTYGPEYAAKVSVNKFAVGVLDYIDQCRASFSAGEMCDEFGLDRNKIRVLVGHNGRDAQRHFELTEQIRRLDESIKERIELVYTMTYGVRDGKYLASLQEAAQETGCSAVFLTDFLDEVKMAKLRCVSDIMLHAQLTDSFSSSMLEALYAGTVIINGSWLNYGDIPGSHDRFVEFDDMTQIPAILKDVVENLAAYRERMAPNKAVVADLVSRRKTTAEWKRILDALA